MNEMNDKSGGREKNRTIRPAFVSIRSPQPYDGVGRALSSAFSAVELSDLPDNMIRLLNQLK